MAARCVVERTVLVYPSLTLRTTRASRFQGMVRVSRAFREDDLVFNCWIRYWGKLNGDDEITWGRTSFMSLSSWTATSPGPTD